jgi:hypothetical protein
MVIQDLLENQFGAIKEQVGGASSASGYGELGLSHDGSQSASEPHEQQVIQRQEFPKAQ